MAARFAGSSSACCEATVNPSPALIPLPSRRIRAPFASDSAMYGSQVAHAAIWLESKAAPAACGVRNEISTSFGASPASRSAPSSR